MPDSKPCIIVMLRFYQWFGVVRGAALGADHGQLQLGQRTLIAGVLILSEASAAPQPAEEPPNYPAPRKHLEAPLFLGSRHNLKVRSIRIRA